ncbi:hypothetical protein BJ138DRAFT_60180 [Hygrophoropsis aurantiaca]|uniref:Uncharacterized protein n=1 Tax=Hygrophoropsis aurantiaca TaxID=72124 RepID=A0ACB8AQI7_9AGAM|nr:hypothetical protein BJ138DRAFT_60180 [Hygrophoropsis aurantiaca]
MSVSLEEAAVLSVTSEGVFYGVAALMAMSVIRDGWPKVYGRRICFVVSMISFLLSTVHLALHIVHADLRVRSKDTHDASHALMSRILISKYAIYVIQTCLSDTILIWRSYAISGSRTCYAFFPALLWVCAIGIGATAISLLSISGDDHLSDTPASPWIAAFYGLTLATHFSGTAIIVFFISHHFVQVRRILRSRGTSYLRIIVAHIGAHLMYGCVVFATLICFLCKCPVIHITAELVVPIASITQFITMIRPRPRRNQPHPVDLSFEAQQRTSMVKDDVLSEYSDNEEIMTVDISDMPICTHC